MNLIIRFFSAFIVSAYLLLALFILVIKKKIAPPPVEKLIRSWFFPEYIGELANFTHDRNFCWKAKVPGWLISDHESISWLELLEDGRPLGPPHTLHEEIRHTGMGRYSHSGNKVWFSTSDNSSPLENGRKYIVREIPGGHAKS